MLFGTTHPSVTHEWLLLLKQSDSALLHTASWQNGLEALLSEVQTVSKRSELAVVLSHVKIDRSDSGMSKPLPDDTLHEHVR